VRVFDGANFTGIRSPILSATTRSGGFPGALLGMGDTEVTGCDMGSACRFARESPFRPEGSRVPAMGIRCEGGLHRSVRCFRCSRDGEW
jgi:hypothetical protein